MRLDQFKFKKSLQFGIKEEAELKTDSNTTVLILRNDLVTQLVKKVGANPVYNVCFQNDEKGQEKLNKALKNIGKR